MAAVLKAVKAGGVADADIRTVGLTIQRERVRVKKKTRVRYRAEQTIVVHVRNVATLAPLIDAAAEAGADQIGDPEFGFADPSAGRTLATRAALADARRRADDAAAVVGTAHHRRALGQPRPGLRRRLRRTELERRRRRQRRLRQGADPGLTGHPRLHRARPRDLHRRPRNLKML